MAHYAILNLENIVESVIVGIDENIIIDGKTPEEIYEENTGKKVKRTSIGALFGKHYEWKDEERIETNKPAFRLNFANEGYIYDESLDAFLLPKCHKNCLLNEQTGAWICEY